MRVDSASGLLLGDVHYLPSPNCDARPARVPVDLIVLHGISLPPGEFGGPWIDELFTNCLDPRAHPYFSQIAELRVSSHLCVRRDGGVIQYVPLHLRAWHAGASRFEDRECCNDFSIGIELEGTDEIPYEPAQYQSLVRVLRAVMEAYPAITPDRIVGHSDIAPGRKTDPGPAFDWKYLAGLLHYPG